MGLCVFVRGRAGRSEAGSRCERHVKDGIDAGMKSSSTKSVEKSDPAATSPMARREYPKHGSYLLSAGLNAAALECVAKLCTANICNVRGS